MVEFNRRIVDHSAILSISKNHQLKSIKKIQNKRSGFFYLYNLNYLDHSAILSLFIFS